MSSGNSNSSCGSGAGKVVCVTGASGYIASCLVKLLLEKGYVVKASVRDPENPKKTEHLLGLEGAKDRLHLFKADLLEEGCFDSIVEGCEGVFHTASPFYFDVEDPQAEMLDPAVKGTLNVLSSCAKVVVDEAWFSDPEICRKSKTLAEEAAWSFTNEKGIDMVSINPAMVIGPLLQPTLNTSAAEILNLIDGSETFVDLPNGWVNVKDVADAHVKAFEATSASGRYCLVERTTRTSDIIEILGELYPSLPLPRKRADEGPVVPKCRVSKEKVKSLGVEYISLRQSVEETVESLKEKGFVCF